MFQAKTEVVDDDECLFDQRLYKETCFAIVNEQESFVPF